MSLINSRLETFFKTKGYKVTDFEAFCGITKGVISGAIREKRNLGIDKLESILNKFPDINLYWLIGGEGEMLRSEKTVNQLAIGNGNNLNNAHTITIGECQEKVKGLEAVIEKQQEEILFLREIVKRK